MRKKSSLVPGLLFILVLAAAPVCLHAQAIQPLNLTCSPAPCILPNVRASEGGLSVTTAVIAANPANSSQLLVAADDSNCASRQGAFSSSNGGSSWFHVCLASLVRFLGDGQPIGGYDLNGVAYAGGLEFDAGDPPYAIGLASSTDNGHHWGAPVEVIGSVLGYTAFMPALAIDDNPSSANKNAIYVSSTQMDASENTQIWVAHSTDGGNTWTSAAVEPLQKFPVMDTYSNVAVAADGTIYLSYLHCPGNGPTGDCGGITSQMMLSKSSDAGNTWSPVSVISPVNLAPDLGGCYFGCLPNTFIGVTNIPVLAADSSAPANLYAAFYNWTGAQLQVEVTASSDGGSTWDSPVRVSASKAGDEFDPWVSVDASGRVVVTWLDRRNDPHNLKFQPVFAFSRDDGATFSPTRLLTNFQSDPSSQSFGDDYRTQVSVGAAVYAVWMDHRSGSWQTEVGGVLF